MPPPFLQQTRAMLRAGIVTTAVFLLAPQALSASHGSLAMGPLNVTLVDLRPEDGVSPTFDMSLSGFDAGLAVIAGNPWPLEADIRVRYGHWSGAEIEAETRHAGALARMSGGGSNAPDSPHGVRIFLDGRATDFSGAPGLRAEFTAEAQVLASGQEMPFVLAPWSEIRFEIDLEAMFASTGEADSVGALALLRLRDDTHGGHVIEDPFQAECFGTCRRSVTDRLLVTLSNPSADALDARFTVGGRLAGWSYASAVPEPSGVAMLLAGITGIATLTRRRSAQRSAGGR